MSEKSKQRPRFSASKREFLKHAALCSFYVGPVIRSFEMAEIAAKATGPSKKKKATKGTARVRRPRGGRDLA